ncbi:MAG: V-type ATPase 116kDa subunit family protein [Actinomycetota bacterium]|nr:V-type ATPase 116kDa subunit family protein [Actinomycetota bacterium]
MLVPMAKVEIIGPKNLFFDVVSLVHEQGRLHIEDLTRKIQSGEVPIDRMEVVEKQQRDQESMDDMLIRVRAILKALHRDNTPVNVEDRRQEYARMYALDSAALAAEIASVIAEVEDRTSSLASSHTSIEGELALLARYEPILHKIQPLAKQIITTGAYESVALLVERRYKAALEQLKEELDKITHKQCEIVSTDVDADTTAAIVVFSRTYSEPVHKFLAMENVNQIRLPSEFQDMPFDIAYDELRARRGALPGELGKVSTELEKMSLKWQLKLSTIRDVLIDKTEEISAIPKFGRTEYAFVITGWMPVKDVKPLMAQIMEHWKDDVIVNQTEIREDEYSDTPVALKNNPAMEPFQKLLGVYGMPRYGTMDATWMLFVFYPLFFGMIVGDLGYGMIMMGIILWLRFKFKDNDNITLATSILGPAATAVIAFGFLYGEFFGNLLGEKYFNVIRPLPIGPVTLPFDRVHFVETFMLLAVAVGVVQILLGLVFGIVNAVRTKNKHHLYEKGGMLVMLVSVGLAIAIGFATENFGSWTIWGQLLFAAFAFGGFIYAIRGGGVMGAVESILSVSHMASYIRIMAVGLAGAIFADAVNGIVANTGNIVAGLVIGILLHGLNFIIAAFSPSIHALRLNFLEFFGTFYETGSQQYKPFTKTGGEKSA